MGAWARAKGSLHRYDGKNTAPERGAPTRARPSPIPPSPPYRDKPSRRKFRLAVQDKYVPDLLEATLEKRLRHWWEGDAYDPAMLRAGAANWQTLRPLADPGTKTFLLKTWFNCWMTRSRTGGVKRACLFGCNCGQDSLWHYATCWVGVEATQAVFPWFPFQIGLAQFLLVDRPLPADVAYARAAYLAVTYKVFCGRNAAERSTPTNWSSARIQRDVRERYRARWATIVGKHARLRHIVEQYQ